MKIDNQTKWETRALRGLVRRVLAKMRGIGSWSDEHERRVSIKFKPARQSRCSSGRAWHRSGRIEIFVPTRLDSLTPALLVDLASVIAHECAHVSGHHDERSMRASLWWGRPCLTGYRNRDAEHPIWGWAAGACVPATAVVRRPVKTPKERGAELVERRAARAAAALARWERRLATARRKVRDARRRVRYYDRARAARATTPSPATGNTQETESGR